MQPVIFSLGPLAISSFGFFVGLGLFAATFLLWRLARLYEFKEEKILDLTLLTFFGGLLGARLYTVLAYPALFNELNKIILINRFPGLSFWGGFLGGIAALWFFSKKLKMQFWPVADLAVLGFTIGMIFGNLGCYLGGCAYGVVSSLPGAVSVVGITDKRLPLPLLESLFLVPVYFYLQVRMKKFHAPGQVAAVFLIILGAGKFIAEFYRGEMLYIPGITRLSLGHLLASLVFLGGVLVYYRRARRVLKSDINFIGELVTSSKKRDLALSYFKKSCYNYQVNLRISIKNALEFIRKAPKILKRKFNVKSTPTNY